jgi:hypothetical protein
MCSIDVTFAPASATNLTGSLNMVGDMSGSVLLTGTRTAVAPVPPTAGTPTITAIPASATGTPGQTFTFTLTTTNFGKAPTLTAGCSKIPATTCSIQGATLSVQTTKPSTSTPALVFPSIPTYMRGVMLLGLVIGLITVVRKRQAKVSLALAALVISRNATIWLDRPAENQQCIE